MTSERKAEFESCFSCNVEFHFPKGIEQFEDPLEDFKAHSLTLQKWMTTSIYLKKILQIAVLEKKTKYDRLIVMDDFSGLDEESKELKIFNSLT